MFKKNVFNKKLKAYNIPFSFLKYLDLTEDQFELEKITFPNSPSILELVEEKKKASFMGSFTSLGKPSNGTDKNRVNFAVNALREKEYHFIPIYLGIFRNRIKAS